MKLTCGKKAFATGLNNPFLTELGTEKYYKIEPRSLSNYLLCWKLKILWVEGVGFDSCPNRNNWDAKLIVENNSKFVKMAKSFYNFYFAVEN
jgi:hypothetical protein